MGYISLFIVGNGTKEKNVFLLIQPLKSQKTNLKYQLKIYIPTPGQKLAKDTIQLSCCPLIAPVT
jgi:hypothetical protein